MKRLVLSLIAVVLVPFFSDSVKGQNSTPSAVATSEAIPPNVSLEIGLLLGSTLIFIGLVALRLHLAENVRRARGQLLAGVEELRTYWGYINTAHLSLLNEAKAKGEHPEKAPKTEQAPWHDLDKK